MTMQTKFAEKRIGTLNKFFTKPSVGTILASHIASDEPTSVLDLGAGEGSLSVSVVQRWPNVRVVTVDLDASTATILSANLRQAGCTAHQHYVQDAFDPKLPAGIIQKHGKFDIAVCNPPFFNPKWDRSHADILQKGSLADACATTNEATAEILFIAQSLALLKDGGRLAVIVPDSLATTSRATKFRQSLLRNHAVEKVLQLPINSFLETDAQCFIIILRKGDGPTQSLKLLNTKANQSISQPIEINQISAENRMDYNFHSMRCEKLGSHTSLRKLGAEVFRGTLNTVQRKTANFPVFHTADYKLVHNGKIKLPEQKNLSDKSKIVAETGDILLARVDRNLHQKIGMVVSGAAVPTDCVYRIRLPSKNRNKAFAALCSDTGRKNLQALTKGVGARIIGKADLLDMPLSIETH